MKNSSKFCAFKRSSYTPLVRELGFELVKYEEFVCLRTINCALTPAGLHVENSR